MSSESLPILTHDRNFLHFWEEAAENAAASAKAGRAVFDSILYMKIRAPGDKSEMVYAMEKTLPDGTVIKKSELAWKRYGKYVDEYKAKGAGVAVTGTPIEMWPLVDTRRVAMLKHNGIYNVESLASLGDAGIATLGMGGRELVQKAKDWLASAADNATKMQAAEEKRQLQSRLDGLQEQITGLAEALNELPPEAQAQVRASLGRRGKKAAA